MNRNCCTNSVPYGYGGRRADTKVFPVRIIMSPTCSSRFLVGKKTRSAAAPTIPLLLPFESLCHALEARQREPSCDKQRAVPAAQPSLLLAQYPGFRGMFQVL